MNTKNNQKFQETDARIRAAFLEALQKKKISEITVAEICRAVGINRSSFYLHFLDVYDILEKMTREVGAEVAREIMEMRLTPGDFAAGAYLPPVFRHMERRRSFYLLYFREMGTKDIETHFAMLLDAVARPFMKAAGIESERRIAYHFALYQAGVLAVVRKWLEWGCVETPEEMAETVTSSIAAIPPALSGADWETLARNAR